MNGVSHSDARSATGEVHERPQRGGDNPLGKIALDVTFEFKNFSGRLWEIWSISDELERIPGISKKIRLNKYNYIF